MTAVTLHHLAGGADRVVVVDTETTGVYPSDRVIEIALVTLSLDGQVVDVYDTLVHPQRDVSASHIHGLTAAMVADAPVWDDVAGDVAVRLQGACVAAHNLPFDRRMVAGEYERIGAHLSVTDGIDTLRATNARLQHACADLGIDLGDAHRALADARATAQLLLCVADHCHAGAPTLAPQGLPRSGRVYRREDTRPVTLPDPPLIAYLASRLRHDGVDNDLLGYLDLLDRVIADLHLDGAERVQLEALATDLGLSNAYIALAHRRLVNDLVDAALDDHEVTTDEYDILLRVAAALDVDQQVVEARTHAYRTRQDSLPLTPGTVVVFTGDHPNHPRTTLIEHARRLGLKVAKGVSKNTDLLIAADPDSTSGKAKKARRYAIPITGAATFASARPGHRVSVIDSTLDTRKVISCPDCRITWTVPATSAERASKRCSDCAALASQTRRPSTRTSTAPPQRQDQARRPD